MNTHRDPWINRATAERLLGGTPGGADPVAGLLAAATATAGEHELTGEQVALAEFRAAHLESVSPPRRPSMLKTTVAKLLAAKLLTATAVASAATGGVALAATTNSLPDRAQGAAHNLFNAPAPRHHGKPKDLPGRGNQPGAKPSGAPGTPSPSLHGLCTAYQAGATSNDGKALTNPAFTALVTAAGGADKLAAYCTTLIGAPSTHPTGKPTAHPSGKPTAHPTGAPSSHPAGKPTALPTAGHPTGQPTSVPAGPPPTHPGRP